MNRQFAALKNTFEAREIARWIKDTTSPDDLSAIPNTHMSEGKKMHVFLTQEIHA